MLPSVLPIHSLQSKNDQNSCEEGISNYNTTTSGALKNNININNSSNDGVNSIAEELVGDTSTLTAKHQLEQLNTMREALFAQDGWGCQHVNQDTNWEVPSSPEPANKDPSGPPMWKPTINNGTDLWESNLRNGGQPPAQQSQKPSWGHTPSSNLGGTWGEDDDGNDSSNVWTGSANNSSATSGVGVGTANVSAGAPGTQWGQGAAVGISGTGNGGNTNSAGIPVVAGGGSSTTNVNASIGATGSTVGVSTAGNGWGDPREMRSGPLGAGPIDMRSVDPRDPMRAVAAGDPRDMRMLDPRDPIRGDPRGISGRLNGNSEMWGHHQQISHSQIPAINKMVTQVVGGSGTNVAVSPAGVTAIGPVVATGGVTGNVAASWGTTQTVVGPKDITKQVTGWEEPSPPPQRRNLPNYDDGTSLWGQQARVPGGGGAAHWKDMSDSLNRSHLMRAQNAAPGIVGPGVAGNGSVQVGGNTGNPMAGVVGTQGRMASAVGPNIISGQHKPDNAMWMARNVASTWTDDSHIVGGTGSSVTGWVDEKVNPGLAQIGNNSNSWNDASSGGWNNKQNKITGVSATSGWNTTVSNVGGDSNDLNPDWSPHGGIVGKPPQQKLGSSINVGGGVNSLNIDLIKQSKQFRILVENGFKKDDVERALISANMNIEEAAELLRANSSLAIDGWRRHDDSLGSYADHTNSTNSSGFSGRYPAAGAQPSMAFPPNNLLNNMSGSAVTSGSNNPNLSAIQMQKYLNQASHNVAVGPPQTVNSYGPGTANSTAAVNITSNTNNQPSAQQLRMLVQQIQLAVHSGFLSSQILNQPLAPTTLMLLNQLLSNIKNLQAAQQSLSRNSSANPLACNVAIAKYKQQIQNLQNQINAQQAIYIKQQQQQQQQQNLPQNSQQQQHPSAHLNNATNEYLRGHDAISALQGNFSDLNINKQSGGYPGASNQQSRLTQWKLPVLEKDLTTDSTDFSRAPGATKPSLSANNANMGPLGLQSDGTWSTCRNISDGWPDQTTDNENKDWSASQPSSATVYTDLVQEFEPGKPWKGAQIKSIEDDPSITPGSVARSPLSINPTPKEADLFTNTGKNSPTELPSLSLSSSTWSFNPNQNFPSWSDNSQQCASELWATSLNKTSRGPPPGLSTNKTGGNVSVTNATTISGNPNGWLAGRNAPTTSTTWSAGGGGGNGSWNLNWLLIKNLTAQIDASTLRTLCMQHGPLVSFHMYLNQGIALCKYATREEANKAQMTLNNCVLGNTTIYAECPNENEVQSILQHLPQTPTSNNSTIIASSGNGNGGGNGSSANVLPGNCNNGSNSNTTTLGSNISVPNNGSCNPGGNGNNISAVGATGTAGIGGNNNTNVSVTSASSTISGSTTNSTISSNVCSIGKNATNNCGNNTIGPGTGNNGSQTKSATMTSTVGVGGSNTTWRQNTQNQTQQQNQTRPTGRETTDFDYISQYVCSIVDD